MAALLLLALDAAVRLGPGSLASWLEAVFTAPSPRADLGAVLPPAWAPVLLLLALCAPLLLLRMTRPRAHAHGFTVDDPATLGAISPFAALASCLLALLLLLAATRGLPAAAARSVDADPAGLAALWLGWARHGLLALSGITAAVGILEWLVSAHRLWQGLHLTPEQAREQARAQSRKR